MSNGLFEHRGLAHQVAVAPWVLAHEAVLEVAKERAQLERREGTSLLRAHRERVHHHLGYGAFAEYTDRHLGYCHRTTADKLRTAEALEQLPGLARAQQEGILHASAVRELARVATAETESAWIDAARGRRVREIEQMVSGRARGDSPTSAPRPELEKHVLRFEKPSHSYEMATNVKESASSRPRHPAENATAAPVRAGAFSQSGWS